MQNAPQHLPALDEYVDLLDFVKQVAHTFPTADSLRWYVRQHKKALADAGALIVITGRLRFHPERFQRAAVEIGRGAVRASR